MRKFTFALVAAVIFAAPALAGGNYRSQPKFDGYSYRHNGKQVYQHYNQRLGGYPAPRCYTSGKRTDCYWRHEGGRFKR